MKKLIVLLGIAVVIVAAVAAHLSRRDLKEMRRIVLPGVRELGEVPEFTLTDQAGEGMALEQLRGKVWIANFIFTRCPGTCPVQTSMMTKLQRELSGHPRWDDIRLVSFSVDPEYDTPEVLRDYARKAGADEWHWKFLTGPRGQIWKLSKEGFKLAVGENLPGSNMPVFHSSKLVLVGLRGRIRGYYDGLSQEGLDELKRDLNTVIGENLKKGGPAPQEIMDPPGPEDRRKARLATAYRFTISHDFRFADRASESGIISRRGPVAESAKECITVHYDQGNGVSIADVRREGLYDIYFSSQVGSNHLWKRLG